MPTAPNFGVLSLSRYSTVPAQRSASGTSFKALRVPPYVSATENAGVPQGAIRPGLSSPCKAF